MIAEAFAACADLMLNKKKDEGFESGMGYPVGMRSTSRLIGSIAYMILVLVLILSVGQYLWNNHAVKLVSFLKPSKSIMDILGLILLLRLMGL